MIIWQAVSVFFTEIMSNILLFIYSFIVIWSQILLDELFFGFKHNLHLLQSSTNQWFLEHKDIFSLQFLLAFFFHISWD